MSEWVSMAIRSLDLFLLPLDFPSFTLQGNDLGRFEVLLALLSLSAWSLNSRAECDFLLACGLRETA